MPALVASPWTSAEDRGGTGIAAEVVLVHRTERSVLDAPGGSALMPFVVAGRNRLATCSGVAWFCGWHLCVANLYGGHIRVYRFEPGSNESGPAHMALLHEMTQGIAYPEDVAVAPDGALLAVTNSVTAEAGVSLHGIDPVSLLPGTGEMIRPGRAFHGLSFSPDSRHLAITEIGDPGQIEVLFVAAGARERRCLIKNRRWPLKPKSVAFSSDGRLVAISWSSNVTPKHGAAPLGGALSLHRFDSATGIIETDTLAELRDAGGALGTVEICKFLPSAEDRTYRILAANQGADAVTAFEFDRDRRNLVFREALTAAFSFPHGLDCSADGRFIAVANYGDDTLRILRVASGAASEADQPLA